MTLPRSEELEKTVHEALRADLLARNEPAPYLTEYAVGLVALATSGAIPRSLASIPGDLLTRVQAVMARTFADRSSFKVYGGPAEEERGAWWLVREPAHGEGGPELPLADRVEMEIVRFMQKQPPFTFEELDQRICAQFPGLLTPPAGLVRACLESYGEVIPNQQDSSHSQTWRMRASEVASARRADLQQMRAALTTVGQRLGFVVAERGSLLAWERDGKAAWRFGLMASSILSRYVLPALTDTAGLRVLVLPGSRARLVSYKLRRDPRMTDAVNAPPSPWRFLKFRHLREIADQPGLTLADWESLLDKDPLTDEATQMELFSDLH